MISILCPTRGRPQQLSDMWASACDTANDPAKLELVLYVDEDDPTLLPDLADATVVVGPRITLSDCWNHCARAATGDILGLGNDDTLYRTAGWDTMVQEAFSQLPDRIGLVYGRDGIHDGALASLGFVHRRWVDAVGYFTSPRFSCDYADTWLNDVADGIGRKIFVPGMLIEHMHPLVGKAPVDRTHEERIERGTQDGVAELYASLSVERDADMAKLRVVMQ